MTRTFALRLPLALAALLLSACGDETGPLMRPGENCMTCHTGGGQAPDQRWTIAGTVYTTATDGSGMGVSGVNIIVTDANSKQVTLTSNAVGNFYSKELVSFPLSTELRRGANVQKMAMKVSTGACASCHNQPSSGGAPGRLFIAP